MGRAVMGRAGELAGVAACWGWAGRAHEGEQQRTLNDAPWKVDAHVRKAESFRDYVAIGQHAEIWMVIVSPALQRF
jgi:hypothetical protein